jgi:hypothetical protein
MHVWWRTAAANVLAAVESCAFRRTETAAAVRDRSWESAVFLIRYRTVVLSENALSRSGAYRARPKFSAVRPSTEFSNGADEGT